MGAHNHFYALTITDDGARFYNGMSRRDYIDVDLSQDQPMPFSLPYASSIITKLDLDDIDVIYQLVDHGPMVYETCWDYCGGGEANMEGGSTEDKLDRPYQESKLAKRAWMWQWLPAGQLECLTGKPNCACDTCSAVELKAKTEKAAARLQDLASENQTRSNIDIHSLVFLIPRLEAGVEFAGRPQLTEPCEIPADGLCMYHCFNAAQDMQTWLNQSRSSGGVALCTEREQQEAHDANVLKSEVISLMQSNGERQAIQDIHEGKFSGTDVLPYICELRNLTVKYHSTVEPLAAVPQYYGQGLLTLEIEHLHSLGEDGHAAPHYRVQQYWGMTQPCPEAMGRAHEEEFHRLLNHGGLFSFPRGRKQLEKDADTEYVQKLATYMDPVPRPWELQQLALISLSYFGTDFLWYRAAAQDDEESFLHFCYVGRVLDGKWRPIRNEQVKYETHLTGRAKAFYKEFRNTLLPGMDLLHQSIARGPLAGHQKVVYRGLAFSGTAARDGVMDALLTHGLKEYGSFTTDMSTASTFMRGISNSVLLMQIETCGYQVPLREYGLLVICLGFAGTCVSPLNSHNASEGEVWLEWAQCACRYDSRISGTSDGLVDFLMQESVDCNWPDWIVM
jgi:hypothetical protein